MRTEPQSTGNPPQAGSVKAQTVHAPTASAKEIAPELKAWLDVLVPMLVRQYLSEMMQRDNIESSIPVNGSERVQ